MEIYKEIRAFYIKLPKTARVDTKKMIADLWSLSKEIHICSIEVQDDGIQIHSEIEFSPETWEASVRYLKCAILLFRKKYGYLIIRKVLASPNSLKTELESYKVTKRGIYNADIPDCKSFIDDILRFSGSNKSLLSDTLDDILIHIDDSDIEKENEEN